MTTAALDYEIGTAPSYQGDGKRVPCIEVFNAVTGETVSFCRRRPFEAKDVWIARALDAASA